jgi:hypothetical protein
MRIFNMTLQAAFPDDVVIPHIGIEELTRRGIAYLHGDTCGEDEYADKEEIAQIQDFQIIPHTAVEVK